MMIFDFRKDKLKVKEKGKKMKKFNGWTFAEMVIAITIIIIISGIGINVFKPNVQETRIYTYAAVKNLLIGANSVYSKYSSLDNSKGNTNDTNDEWFCIQMGDLYTLKVPYDCKITNKENDKTNDTKVNMMFTNGMTIQGLTNKWIGPEGVDYQFKNIVIDINGQKAANKVGFDRIPLRIYKGNNVNAMIMPVNCKDDSYYLSDGTKKSFTDSDGKSPYCKNGFSTFSGSAIQKDFKNNSEILAHDIYKANSNDSKTTANIVSFGRGVVEADCGAFGGTGFYSKKECGNYSARIFPKCASTKLCTTCQAEDSSYNLCPDKDKDGKTVAAPTVDTCNEVAAALNPSNLSCFTVVHKPTGGLGILFGDMLGEIDL